MRFSPKVILSLLAITPVVVVSAPAPQNDAASGTTGVATSAGSGTSTGSAKACTRGRGRGRPGQDRPTDSAIPSASAATAAATNPSPDPVESPPVESTPVQATPVPAPSTPEPSAAEEVNLVATDQSGGQQSTGGDAQPTGDVNANAEAGGTGSDSGAGFTQSGASSTSQPPPSASSNSGTDSGSDSESSGTSGTAGSDSGSGGPADGFEADILKAHNEARAKFNAPPMTWESASAKAATDYYTSTGCAFAHSGMKYGECIVGAAISAQESVDMWMAEEPKWHPGMGFDINTGHFTQVVWKNSTKLGCAQVDCGAKGIVACEYSPGGNVDGKYDTMVGKT